MLRSLRIRIISHAAPCTRHNSWWAFLDASGCSQRISGRTLHTQNRHPPALSCLLSDRLFSSNTRIPEIEHVENVDVTKIRRPQALQGHDSMGALLEKDKAVVQVQTGATIVRDSIVLLKNGDVIRKKKKGTPSKLAPEVVYTLPAKKVQSKWTAQAVGSKIQHAVLSSHV